jgi:hypothetical protein
MSYRPIPIATTIPSDDTSYDGIVARLLPQRVDRIGFTKTLSNTVDPDWGTVVGGIGAGMDVDQTGGNLVITSGTTARSETIIRSTASWEGGIRLRVRNTLSQRIINQNFFVELVDVIGDGLSYNITSATAVVVTIPSNPFTADNIGQFMHLGLFNGTGTFLGGRYPIASISGNDVTFTVSGFAAGTGTCSVFGWNYYQLRYQGTTATSVDFDTQRNGWSSGFTAATINTTTTPGHLAIVTGNDLTATLSDQLVASGAAVAVTPRASRVENVPDDIPLRLQIRVQNLATAPASTTTWTIGLISVSNYAAQDVSIQDVRPMTTATSVPVDVVRTVVGPTQPVSGTVTANIGTGALAAGTNAIGDIGIQYRGSSTGAGTVTNLNCPATPAAQNVKATAGRLIGFYLVNTNTTIRWLKVFNASAPTLASTAAVMRVPLPQNQPVYVSFDGGMAFSSAITFAISSTGALTDATGAVTLDDVTGFAVWA